MAAVYQVKSIGEVRAESEVFYIKLETPAPYKNSPEVMWTFAMRSPFRPNPLAVSVVRILSIDLEEGIINIDYTDAFDKSPVLDIKPYTPSIDRIENQKYRIGAVIGLGVWKLPEILIGKANLIFSLFDDLKQKQLVYASCFCFKRVIIYIPSIIMPNGVRSPKASGKENLAPLIWLDCKSI